LAEAEEEVQEKQLRNSIIEEILKLRSDPRSAKGLDKDEITYQLQHVQSQTSKLRQEQGEQIGVMARCYALPAFPRR